VLPANAPMALRIALFELRKLVEKGLTQQQFETTRDYLMKNVFVMTATQDQHLGYALDSRWAGTAEFTLFMRRALAELRLADVNAAIKRHFPGQDLQVVMITKDAQGLAEALRKEPAEPVKYDAPKPPEVIEEDRTIAAMPLGLAPDAIRITPVEEVFAK
jgi:zinc protease